MAHSHMIVLTWAAGGHWAAIVQEFKEHYFEYVYHLFNYSS